MTTPEIRALRIIHDHRHMIGLTPGSQSCSCGRWNWRQEGQPLSHDAHLAAELMAIGATAFDEGAALACDVGDAAFDRNPYRSAQ